MSTVLVCYERESDQELIRKLLEGRSYSVVVATTGFEALDTARKNPPDLIVSDVLLPRMDGFALCRKCKQDERLQFVPFVFYLTRRDDPKYERFALEVGAERYIARKGDSDDFIRAVEELLRGDVGQRNAKLKAREHAQQQAQSAQVEAKIAEQAQAELSRLQTQIVELENTRLRLIAGEQRFRQLFESNPSAMWLTDSATAKLSAVNDAALLLLGFERAEFLAKTPSDLMTGGEAVQILPGQVTWLSHKDGRHLAVLRSVQPMNVEGRQSELSVITDITARVAAERALADRADMYQSAVAATPGGYWLLDLEGHLIDVNEAYCALSGYSRGDLLQMNVSQLELDVLAETTMRLHLKSGVGPTRYRAKHRTRDGRLIDVEVDSQRLEGRSSHRVAFIRDLSTRTVELTTHEIRRRNTESLMRLLQRADQLDDSSFVHTIAEHAASRSESPLGLIFQLNSQQVWSLAAIHDASSNAASLRAERAMLDAAKLWDEVVRTRQPLINNDANTTTAIAGLPPLHRHLVLPLLEADRVSGLLLIANRERDYTLDDANELQAAISTLWHVITSKRRNVQTLASLQHAEVALESMIDTMNLMIQIHDPFKAGSGRRVAALARAIGRELGLDNSQQQALRLAGLLHDIGIVTVPAEIWSRPRPLTAAETALTQTYPEQGARLVEAIDFGVPVSEIIYQHQERLDGSGYPRRLKADQILLEARIIAVSDALEAMCALRPHRADMQMPNALEELKRDSKSRFDERVVAACVHLFEQRGFRFPE